MIARVMAGLVIAAQLAVPVWMIAGQERILREGAVYRFRTAPVDPYDIFRGRYVSLTTEAESRPVKVPGGMQFRRGQDAYLQLSVDKDGYTQIAGAYPSPPSGGDYIRGGVRHQYGDQLSVKLPFDRYYLNEKNAPEAERLYREAGRQDEQETYIQVRILRGDARIEALIIDGVPVDEHFKKK